uniref:Uncharacterized protein n=1 Tax=Heterorhabditis bacteriophora TaxID=37862 RepID=A0A1I7XIK3_HETBA
MKYGEIENTISITLIAMRLAHTAYLLQRFCCNNYHGYPEPELLHCSQNNTAVFHPFPVCSPSNAALTNPDSSQPTKFTIIVDHTGESKLAESE